MSSSASHYSVGSYIIFSFLFLSALRPNVGHGRVRTELQFHPDSAWKRSSKTCMKVTSAECTVEKTPDDGQRSCPKRVEFYD
jgi:hypothetical protein